jgi:hypothetical protein
MFRRGEALGGKSKLREYMADKWSSTVHRNTDKFGSSPRFCFRPYPPLYIFSWIIRPMIGRCRTDVVNICDDLLCYHHVPFFRFYAALERFFIGLKRRARGVLQIDGRPLLRMPFTTARFRRRVPMNQFCGRCMKRKPRLTCKNLANN